MWKCSCLRKVRKVCSKEIYSLKHTSYPTDCTYLELFLERNSCDEWGNPIQFTLKHNITGLSETYKINDLEADFFAWSAFNLLLNQFSCLVIEWPFIIDVTKCLPDWHSALNKLDSSQVRLWLPSPGDGSNLEGMFHTSRCGTIDETSFMSCILIFLQP